MWDKAIRREERHCLSVCHWGGTVAWRGVENKVPQANWSQRARQLADSRRRRINSAPGWRQRRSIKPPIRNKVLLHDS